MRAFSAPSFPPAQPRLTHRRALLTAAFCFLGSPNRDSAPWVRSLRSPESRPVPPRMHSSVFASVSRSALFVPGEKEGAEKETTPCIRIEPLSLKPPPKPLITAPPTTRHRRQVRPSAEPM